MLKTIETKVIAAVAGTIGGGVLGKFILWLVAVLAFHAPPVADKAGAAIAAVPDPVSTLIFVLVAGLGTAIGGYSAPHSDPSRTETTTPAQSDTLTEANAIFPN